jgi:hypothetical protein
MKRISTLCALLFFTLSLIAAPVKKQIKLQIANNVTTFTDETSIYLDYGVTTDYNYLEDSKKVFGTSPLLPQIFSYSSDTIACAINGFGQFTSSTIITLGVKVESSGTFTILPTLLDNFDATSIIRLEDRLTGTFTDLRQGGYSFSLSGAALLPDRFYIHVSYPTQITTVEAGCTNNNGVINIDQDTSITWNLCQLYDDNNNLITALNSVTGQYQFTGLAEGNYSIVFIYGTYTTPKAVFLKGNQISISISAAPQTVAVGQTINFYSVAPNTTWYLWNFGDGSTITGIANPGFEYYAPGIYTVLLKCTNAYGCIAYASVTVTISPSTGITETGNVEANAYATGKTAVFNTTTTSPVNYSITSLNGQVVVNGQFSGSNYRLNLNDYSNGIYIATLTSPSFNISRKLFIGN